MPYAAGILGNLTGVGVGQLDKAQQVVEMQKAMAMQQLGTLGFAPGPGQIGVQSMEGQLYVLNYGDSEFKLYQDLQRVPVFNWVHEFNVIQYYGSSVGAFVGPGLLPPVNYSYYKRGFATVKFALDLRMIPQQMLEIQSAVGNYYGQEVKNAIMALMGKVNNALYWGNSALNEFIFDGARTQILANSPDNVIDLRGAALDPGTIEKAALQVRLNWGDASMCKLYAPPAVVTPFTTQYIMTQRSMPMFWEGGAGNPFSYWDTQFGRIYIRDDRFAERDPFNGPFAIQTLSTVPPGLASTPTAAPTVGTPATDSASLFNAQTPGGWFAWCYSYINSVGVSVVSPISAATQIQNGQSAQLTFPTVGANPAPTGVRVYRQFLAPAGTLVGNVPTPSYSGMQLVTDITATVSTAGTTWLDENTDIPGTYNAFLIHTGKDGMHIGKLGEMRRFDLAPVTMAAWWASAWYGMPILPATQFSVVLRNIAGSTVGVPVQAGYAA